VTQLEIMPRPPDTRAPSNPWPQWSFVYRVSSAHEEGGERLYSVNTERFVDDGNGNVRALLIHEVEMVDGRFQKVEGSDQELPADLVFLAMGFVGPEKGSWLDQLGVDFDERGNVPATTAT
jgi:glutamate synthase (NADPH) small chain